MNELLEAAKLAAAELRHYWEEDLRLHGPGLMLEGLEALEDEIVKAEKRP